MKQHLVVEGKDFYAIGALCKVHFKRPVGFNKLNEKEFLRGGKGFPEILKDFKDVLNVSDLTHAGLIVDADFNGVSNRFNAILSFLSSEFNQSLDNLTLTTEGVNFELNGIQIGIWLMPDNQINGYLEHFIESMIEEDDLILQEAKSKVDELLTKEFCLFSDIQRQKAVIRSWLAWQKQPGQPFGTAIEAQTLNPNTSKILPFLNWIEKTFEFTKE